MKNFFILFLIFLLGACTNIEKTKYVKAKYPEILPVDLKKYSGFIDREGDTYLSFQVSGNIREINTYDGEAVKKGKLLCALNSDEYQLQIKKAENELKDAIVKYERAKSYFERISKLYSAGGISYNDWESAQTNLKSADNQIKILKEEVKIQKTKESYSRIYAPNDGIVIDVMKDKGQYAKEGETVIYFQSKGGLEAKFFISEKDINSIKKGEVVFLNTVNGEKIKGFIKTIVYSSTATGSFEVTAKFPDCGKNLKDGMTAEISKREPENKNDIYIPINALIYENSKMYVFTIVSKEKKFYAIKKEVQTGKIQDNKILIKSGLNLSDFVVIERQEGLFEGDEVKIYE